MMCRTTSGRYLSIASHKAWVASGLGAPPGAEVSKIPRESITCQVAKRSGKVIRCASASGVVGLT